MNFNYVNHLGDLELDAKHTGDIRLYNLPNGEWVPSITSVTSFYKRETFVKWRKKLVLRKRIASLREQLPVEQISMKQLKFT